jgi:hypothetical protein
VLEIRSGKWLDVESEKDKTILNFRIGSRTIYNPRRFPDEGEKVKVEYLTLEGGALVAYTVTILGLKTQEAGNLAPSISEQCHVPIWNVGDSWRFRYSNGKEWRHTVERIEGNLYIMDDGSWGKKLCRDRGTLNEVAYLTPEGKKMKPQSPSILYLNFPIYIGRKWKRMHTDTGRTPAVAHMNFNYLNEYKVLSYGSMTVPAGTFNAYKIELKQTIYEQRPVSGKAYIWYSPEVQFYIKVVFEKAGYWAGFQDFELISFDLKDRQPLKSSPPEEDAIEKPQAPLPEKPLISVPKPSSSVSNIVTVIGTFANIRSGAGNEFPIITTVKEGDKLILLGESGDWFNVRLGNGQEGWVNNRFAK